MKETDSPNFWYTYTMHNTLPHILLWLMEVEVAFLIGFTTTIMEDYMEAISKGMSMSAYYKLFSDTPLYYVFR